MAAGLADVPRARHRDPVDAGTLGRIRRAFGGWLPSDDPLDTERALICGTTGSGKTYLETALLRAYRRVVVYDVKPALAFRRAPGYHVVARLRDLIRAGRERRGDTGAHRWPRLIYRPGPEELDDDRTREFFFRWVWLRGNCTLAVDEVSLASPGGLGRWYRACLTSGREKGLVVLSATQRPFGVPMPVLTESEHLFCFALGDHDSRDRIARNWGVPRQAIERLDPERHEFLHARRGRRAYEGPVRLRLV